MIEAQIECMCNKIMLADLGLNLSRNQVAFVAADDARKSVDLRRAWKGKAVAVKYIERCQERRANHPLEIPTPRGMVAAPVVSQPARDTLLVDPDAIAARVGLEVAQQIKALEDRLVARVTAAVVAAMPKVIAAAPVQVLPASRVPGPVTQILDDVPVFIPSHIDGGGLDADLGLEVQEATEGTVSDAAAALRAARKAGKI